MPDHNAEHTYGHTIAFGEAYYRAAVRLLGEVRSESLNIAGVSAMAVDALRSGHQVFANLTTGHMPPYELVNDREGNPAPFRFIEPRFLTADHIALMRAGDALFTNCVNEHTLTARDAGVYVAVFTTYFFNNRSAPPGKVLPNPNDWMPEDVASCVIDSHIPWDQGLVRIPETPEMPVFPGSSIATCAIHWMLTAETAHALTTGAAPDGRAGRRYLDTLFERLSAFHRADMDRVSETATVMARRIIAGGRYFVRSRNFGVQSESQAVAQGLMLTNAFEPRPASEGGERDIFLIAAVLPDDPQELDWAAAARANGNYVIGVGPTTNDGLRERCDVYFDDQCDEPGGAVQIPGRDEPVCPATGILNNIIAYTLTAQFVDEMCRRGAVPYFWRGFYLAGGKAYSEIMRPFFLERGY